MSGVNDFYMLELAKNIVERSVAVPGVQPKLSLSLVSEVMANGSRGRLTIVGAMGGGYIFKPPVEKYPEMPQNEHVTMRIAEAFINTSAGNSHKSNSAASSVPDTPCEMECYTWDRFSSCARASASSR